MRAGKNLLVVLMVFVLVTIYWAQRAALCAEEAPAAVRDAANDGLSAFMPVILHDDIRQYGFRDAKEVEQATLGQSFQIYTITPDKILETDSSESMEEMISATSIWLFPIVVKDEVRTLLTVGRIDTKWEAYEVGGSKLAKLLAVVQDKYPATEGYDLKFIRVFQASADFVLVSRPGESELVPLESARSSMKSAQGITLSPSDLLPRLQDAVRRNLTSTPLNN